MFTVTGRGAWMCENAVNSSATRPVIAEGTVGTGVLGPGMTLGSVIVVVSNVWERFIVCCGRFGPYLLIESHKSLSKFEKNREVERDAEAGTGRLM